MADKYISVLKMIEQTMTSDLLASTIDLENGVFPVSALDEQILKYAIKHKYSHIPLREDNGDISQVAIVHLSKKRIENRCVVGLGDVIGELTNIGMTPELFIERHYYLIKTGTCLDRIITVSDLNKMPMRTYLHILIDHFETIFYEWHDQTIEDKDRLSQLSPRDKQIIKIRRRQDIMSKLEIPIISHDNLDTHAGTPLTNLQNDESNDLRTIRDIHKRLSAGNPLLGDSRWYEFTDNPSTKRDVENLHVVIKTLSNWINNIASTLN